MKHSIDSTIPTHAGRLPNPSNIGEVVEARNGGQGKHHDYVKSDVEEMQANRFDLKNDIHSDGEF